jgi:type II secretory pathway pseudopilin PulG
MMDRHGERGFTLIELLVSMALTMIVMTAVITIFTVFINDTRYDGMRDQAQNDAKSLVDRMTRELRSAAAQSPGSPGLLERATQWDAIFETVNPSTSPQGQNAAGQYRVRYCLNTSTGTLWRQTDTWTQATPPAVPTSTACPDTSNSDFNNQVGGQPCCVELTDVTNDIDPSNPRPLFTYGPTGYTNIDQIQEVQVNVVTDLNPGRLPGPAPQLSSGVFLRNENTPPVAMFTPQTVGNGSGAFNVTLNGSASSDPNGQSLSYQWYANSGSTTGCTSNNTQGPSTGALSGGTTESFQAGPYAAGTTETFSLVVTDTQGLTNCYSDPVVMQ